MRVNGTISIGWNFWFWWMLANALGAAAGWMVGLITIGNLHETMSISVIVLGIILGTLLGVMQLQVLRQYLYPVSWWVLATILGWGIGFPVGLFISLIADGISILGFALNGAMIGIMTGATQFSILRQSVYKSGWWVLTSALGWAMGFAIGLGGISPFMPKNAVFLGESIDETIGISIAGAIAGAITGILLVQLLQRPIAKAKFRTPTKSKWIIGIYLIFCLLLGTILLTNYRNQFNGLKFDEFDKATRIQIHYLPSSSDRVIRIDDTEKVEFARRFIKGYPNEWERPELAPVPAPSFFIEFFNGEERIGVYGVGPDFLVYGLYWRPLEIEDRMLLIEVLDIPIE